MHGDLRPAVHRDRRDGGLHPGRLPPARLVRAPSTRPQAARRRHGRGARAGRLAFREACETGDLDALVALLDPDVESRSDGGGKVRRALRPVVGRDKVARLFLGLMRRAPEMELVEEDVNGVPGVAVRIAGTTFRRTRGTGPRRADHRPLAGGQPGQAAGVEGVRRR
ncbi:nuclear transport factor 2 family protein [Streptomyces sp. L7]